MEIVHLGGGALVCSRLAFGCWRIARTGITPKDHATAKRAIFTAIDAGYTLFDHADIYCDSRAESVFGALLQETPKLREGLVIATKCGIRFRDDPTPGAPYRYDLSREHIVASCEQSLKRLRIQTIDLFQLHRPDWLMNPEEVAAAFSELHKAGKVREFGVSNFRPAQLTALQKALPFRLLVNQIEVSLLQLSAFNDGSLDQCLAERITPLAWSPLAGGLLAEGAVDILPAQQLYRPERVLPELGKMALARGTTRTALALAWLLKHPACIVPIIGSTQPERIRAAADATEIQLSREEWYRLFAAARAEPLA